MCDTMSSSFTSPIPQNLRPQNRSSKAKNVYGKKKLNSAKAVFEGGEHASLKEKHASVKPRAKCEVENLIDSVQEKLAKVNINGESSKGSSPSPNAVPDVPSKKKSSKPRERVCQNDEKLVEIRIPTRRTESVERQPEKRRIPKRKTEEQTDNKNTEVGGSHAYFSGDKETLSYVRPILDEATAPISSRGVQRFDMWAKRAADVFNVKKIAEGSYGEVYQLRVRDDISKSTLSKPRLAKFKAYRDGVFKIVPLRARRGAGSKKFTTVQEIVAEVQLLKLLDPIPGFARFREIHVVQGRFPVPYQDAWDEYSQTMDDCFNPDPSKKKSYPDGQIWAILEMENAGFELEKFNFSSVFQIYDIFWGVALALARAEQFASFEHRDLHLGNVCVKSKIAGRSSIKSIDPESSTSFGLSGLETTIIDYSLSRADLQSCGFITNTESIAWSDLDKKQIFDAVGRDEDEKLLRNTYRLMRSQVNGDSSEGPGKSTGQWKNYNPETNLIWLSFILTMLLRKCKTESILPTRRQPLGPRSTNKTPNSKKSNENKPLSKTTKVTSKRTERENADLQHGLFERLQTVQDLFTFEDEGERLTCAGDLISIAIGSQWLSESDFLC